MVARMTGKAKERLGHRCLQVRTLRFFSDPGGSLQNEKILVCITLRKRAAWLA